MGLTVPYEVNLMKISSMRVLEKGTYLSNWGIVMVPS